MKVKYHECTEFGQVFERIAATEPRTVAFDVEPLIAAWDTDVRELDEGIARCVRELSRTPSVQTVVFATNSSRTPSVIPQVTGIRIDYRARAVKPLRLHYLAGLPAPGVVIGDQTATDGLLAYRLGYDFIRYRVDRARIPVGPRIMNALGACLKPFIVAA